MLVYEKKVDGERKLFGTYANVPADNDAQLKYKDIDGDELTLATNDKYVDDGKGGIIRKSDEKFMGVFIGNAQKAIIPNGWEPEAREVKKLVVKTAPAKVTYDAGEALDLTGLVLTATYKDGDKVDVTTGYTSVPANGAILAAGTNKVTITYGGKSCEQAITVQEPMTVTPNVWEPTVSAEAQSQVCTVSHNHGVIGENPTISGTAPVTAVVAGTNVTLTLASSAVADQTATVTISDEEGRVCTVTVAVMGA